jgi:hypothetical protein
MTHTEMRCGKCKNCVELEKVKSLVLACCASVKKGIYPSTYHADDGVIQVWNSELARLPCMEKGR